MKTSLNKKPKDQDLKKAKITFADWILSSQYHNIYGHDFWFKNGKSALESISSKELHKLYLEEIKIKTKKNNTKLKPAFSNNKYAFLQ
jgi:accessory colonization factor AcfC